MSDFVSRSTPEMKWDDLVRAWVPEVPAELIGSILMDLTCFPAGGVAEVEPQLAWVAKYWPDLQALQSSADAELDLAMGLPCPLDPHDGWFCQDTCEMCLGTHRIDHTPERQAELRARILP